MEAVGQLTGGIAHDFNNLLTAIQGSIELVFRGPNDLDPETKRLLTSAMRAAQHLSHPGDAAIDIDILRCERLLTRKCEQLMGQCPAPLCRTLGESRQTYFRGRALTGLAVQILA